MPIVFLLILLLAAVLNAEPSCALTSSTSASATLGMQSFSGQYDGEKQEASAIYQEYSIVTKQVNSLYNGRLGTYTLLVGYDFSSLAPKVESNGVRDPDVSQISNGKLRYDLGLMLAPGGLPFRLSLFAKDNVRPKLTVLGGNSRAAATGVAVGKNAAGSLIESEIYDDLLSGTQRAFGGTLLLGIRNGSYLGAYRDSLSQLPRLLVDFEQIEVENLQSHFTRSHYRMRDLAFVSLNKKDNWVHYRLNDFKDFLNPANNSYTRSVMIGTVDQIMARQWINLTNWIRISGDLSYTASQVVNEDPVTTYRVNMFALARREHHATSILSQFTRINDGVTTTSTLDVPMTTRVEIDRDTLLVSRLTYNSEGKETVDGLDLEPVIEPSTGNSETRRSLYLDTLLELQRTRRIVVKPRIQFESYSYSKEDSLSLRLSAEAFSNTHLKNSMEWLAGYALVILRSDEELGAGGSYLQHEMYGRLEKDLSRTLRIGTGGSLTTGRGESGAASGSIGSSFSTLETGLEGSSPGSSASSFSGRRTRGDFSLFAEHRYQRFGNRLEASFEFFAMDGNLDARESLTHALVYDRENHRFKWNSSLFHGGDSRRPTRTITFDYAGEASSNAASSLSWDSQFSYRYDPHRSASLTLSGAVSGSEGPPVYSFSEEVAYRIFTRNGIVRRLAEFSERIVYEKGGGGQDLEKVLSGIFSASYYPTKYLYGKCGSEIVVNLDNGTQQQVETAEVGFSFEKLQLSANYSQGNKDRESAILPKIMERRWEMKVKKIF